MRVSRILLVMLFLLVLLTGTSRVFAEPALEAILDSLGLINRTLSTTRTFPAGQYSITLYAEYAGWKDDNILRWYKTGTTVFNMIFDGPEGAPPPLTKTFAADGEFGLSLRSPDGIYYSDDITKNPDGKEHVRVYQDNSDANLFYIGYENKNNYDFDFNDMVFSLKHTAAYLTVYSLYDSPNPISGWFNVGTDVTATVTSPVSGSLGTRYVCTGWTGTGDVPPSGSGLIANFIIHQDSSITWNWKTQWLLSVYTDPSGLSPEPLRDPSGEPDSSNSWWYDDSTTVMLTAQAVDGFTFAYWDVDSISQGDEVNPITVAMNAPHAVTAHYELSPPVQAVGGTWVQMSMAALLVPFACTLSLSMLTAVFYVYVRRKKKQ